ncbi:hypothetical protein OG285_15170 [Streptomyces sp. NBC_01471]|uniref:hypothetical protein n=1 Tax=Streptomyces sp. NBC_01471 TaxID=2903879 RepID=UPI003248DA9B
MIEALLLRHDPANGFAYRRRITPLERHANPDHTARLLAHLQEDNDRHLVHSTSWRATDNGHIVLTYLIHPDPDPGQPALPLANPHDIAHSDRPAHPTPPTLQLEHVAAHAIRHLAFLGRTDPTVTAHLAHRPHTQQALSAVTPIPAGQLYIECDQPRSNEQRLQPQGGASACTATTEELG